MVLILLQVSARASHAAQGLTGESSKDLSLFRLDGGEGRRQKGNDFLICLKYGSPLPHHAQTQPAPSGLVM